MGLTQHFAVLILLVEVREGGENEAESGDHHEEAGDNGDHLTKVQSISLISVVFVLRVNMFGFLVCQCYTINNRNISIDIAQCTKRK